MMKKQQQFLSIFGCFLLILLAGCRQQLQEEEQTFEADGSEYSFRLPSGWEAEEDYKNVFNEAAVFGAADTQSRSVVFIRVQRSEPLTSETLEEQTRATLSNYYKVEEVKSEHFQVQGHPALHYPLKSVYNDEAAWLDNYFVVTETHLIEFLFYRPRESSTDSQLELIQQSVESVKQTHIAEETESSSQEELGSVQKIENEVLSLRLSGSKINSSNQLIIRYVLTNKSEEALIPAEEWQKIFSLSEGSEKLLPSDEIESKEKELVYLQKLSQELLKSGDSVECAVVYSLKTENEELALQINNGESVQTVMLNREGGGQ